MAWPSSSPHNLDGRARRAGVNSFGYGGANSHVIIDAADMHVPPGYGSKSTVDESEVLPRTVMLLPVSANSDTALKHRILDLSSPHTPHVSTVDLAYTLGVKRSHLPIRGYVLARPGHLEEDVTLENMHSRLQGKIYTTLPLSFVFTGQGAQWATMGCELFAEFPLFKHTIDLLDNTLQQLQHPPTWTIMEALLEPDATSMINHASRSQPICTAVQVGLVDLLSTFGIKPKIVIGHSSGEIAAAYASGHVTAEEAITIAYYRGYTVTESSKVMVGAMMAAGLGRSQADEIIQTLGLQSKINVACVNSPESVTISGDVDGIEKLRSYLDSVGIFARTLKTDGKAYHSRHMAVLGDEYEQYLISSASIVASEATATSASSTRNAKWISSVTGEPVDHPIGRSYWRANLESPVLFETVVERLLQNFGPHHMIEIGPHSALQMPIKQTYSKVNKGKYKLHYGSALSRGKSSVSTILHLAGDLYLHGHSLLFKEVNTFGPWPLKNTSNISSASNQGKILVDLPKYHWDYDPQETLFNEPRSSIEWRNRKYPRHDLLGSQVHGGNGIVTTWRNVLKAKDIPWIQGHRLDTTIVVPAAAYLAMAIEAMSQVRNVPDDAAADGATFKLQQVHISKALVLPEEGNLDSGVEVFTTLQPIQLQGGEDLDWHQFNISSYVLNKATTHATGLIHLADALDCGALVKLPDTSSDDLEPTAPRTWYTKFAEGGLNFQGSFQSLKDVYVHTKRKEMNVLATTETSQGEDNGTSFESKYAMHPITIDSLLQAGIIASTRGIVKELRAKVPVHIEDMTLRSPGTDSAIGSSKAKLSVKAVSAPIGFGTIRVSGEIRNDQDSSLLQINGCRLVAYQSGNHQQDQDERHPMLRVLWKPDITALSAGNEVELSSYINKYIQLATVTTSHASFEQHAVDMARVSAILDLITHKDPRLRVLTLLADETDESYVAEELRFATAFKKCQSLWRGRYSQDGTVDIHDGPSDEKLSKQGGVPELEFDVVLANPGKVTDLASLKSLMARDGFLVYLGPQLEATKFEDEGFSKPLRSQLSGHQDVIVTRYSSDESSVETEETENFMAMEVLIVSRIRVD